MWTFGTSVTLGRSLGILASWWAIRQCFISVLQQSNIKQGWTFTVISPTFPLQATFFFPQESNSNMIQRNNIDQTFKKQHKTLLDLRTDINTVCLRKTYIWEFFPWKIIWVKLAVISSWAPVLVVGIQIEYKTLQYGVRAQPANKPIFFTGIHTTSVSMYKCGCVSNLLTRAVDTIPPEQADSLIHQICASTAEHTKAQILQEFCLSGRSIQFPRGTEAVIRSERQSTQSDSHWWQYSYCSHCLQCFIVPLLRLMRFTFLFMGRMSSWGINCVLISSRCVFVYQMCACVFLSSPPLPAHIPELARFTVNTR